MNLNQEIIEILKQEGCNIVGFADLRKLPDSFDKARKGFDFGIVMGEAYSAEGLKQFLDSGNPDRFGNDSGDAYATLDRYNAALIKFLKSKKFKAIDKHLTTTLTHKTVGTLAGLGWIGRCALLTTKAAGCGLRLTTVLTNAPVKCGEPITKSQCPPHCSECADICPANAIKNGLWEQGIHRDEFFDVKACRAFRNSQDDFCGLCIAACPFTKEGLGYTYDNDGDFDVKSFLIENAKKKKALEKKTPLVSLNAVQVVDFPEENRKNVLKIVNPDKWNVVMYKLKKYKDKHVAINFSADVKRIGSGGDLNWQINNNDHPIVGSVKNAKENQWYSMSGNWVGFFTGSYPVFFLSTWENNSDKTTYYIDNFYIDILDE
jgi:ferredoxin